MSAPATANSTSSATTPSVTPNSGNEAKAQSNGVTNVTVDPKDRKKKLIRKQGGTNPIKYQLWLAGHASAIVFGSISFVFQILWLPNKFYINSIAYRLSLLGSITALTATLSHKFGLSYLPPHSTLVAQQNFQYLVLAVAWIFTFKSIFKIIPYYLIAVLQLSNHKKIDAVLKQAPFLASIIAYDELFLIGYLLIRTVFFRNTSGYQLLLFLFFYWLRILYNKETTTLFKAIIERLDGKVAPIENEKVQHIWGKIKLFLDDKQHSNEY